MPETRPERGAETIEQTRTRVQVPPLFKVILHNDDYTTMEFVVQVLESVFLKQPAEAYRIMMQVHRQGWGVCGLFPYEIAETKVASVHELAQERGFPLRASLEAE